VSAQAVPDPLLGLQQRTAGRVTPMIALILQQAS